MLVRDVRPMTIGTSQRIALVVGALLAAILMQPVAPSRVARADGLPPNNRAPNNESPNNESPNNEPGDALVDIPTSVYKARRERLAKALPDRMAAVVRSGAKPRGEHDTDFRVGSDFVYLTGIDVHDAAVLVWRDGDAVKDVLLLPRRSRMQKRWESPFLHADDPRAAKLGFGWVAARRKGVVEQLLADLAGEDRKAAGRIAKIRQVKDAYEIARLQRAIDMTGDALTEAMRSIGPGMDEHEIQALIEYVFDRQGAERAAFPSIVGSGPNGCVLHYGRNRRVMQAGELVLCDVGAEFDRYAADVTRTFPVSGRFTARQRELYEAVLAAQDAGIRAVRPGATLRTVHAAARAALKERGLDQFYFHGTSHWLGLDVHDVGQRNRRFVPGMVLTVEPGVYLDSEGIGIRIEDDVLVTEDGCRVLSAGIPRSVEAIEALCRARGIGNVPLGGLAPPKPTEPKKRSQPF